MTKKWLYAATQKHSRLSKLRNMTTATTFGGTADGEAVEPAFWVSADSAAPRPRPARDATSNTASKN
jgi:hypothetical protein